MELDCNWAFQHHTESWNAIRTQAFVLKKKNQVKQCTIFSAVHHFRTLFSVQFLKKLFEDIFQWTRYQLSREGSKTRKTMSSCMMKTAQETLRNLPEQTTRREGLILCLWKCQLMQPSWKLYRFLQIQVCLIWFKHHNMHIYAYVCVDIILLPLWSIWRL